MFEADAAPWRSRVRSEVFLDRDEVIRVACRVCVKANDNPLWPVQIIEPPCCFIHANLARQSHSCVFRRQARKIEKKNSELPVRVFCRPFQSFYERLSVLLQNLLGSGLRGIHHHDHFHGAVGPLASSKLLQAFKQERLIETWNDHNESDIRDWRAVYLAFERAKAFVISVGYHRCSMDY